MTAIDHRAPSPYARPEAPVRVRRTVNRLGKAAVWSGGIALACAVVPMLHWATIAFGTAALVMGITGLGSRRRSAGKADTSWIAIVLAVLAFVGMVASQAAFTAVTSVARSDAKPVIAPVAPAVAQAETTQAVLARQAKVEVGSVFQELDPSGITRTALTVTVTNIGSQTRSFDLEFAAIDAKGRTITTDTAFVPILGAGKSASVRVFNILNDDLTAKILSAEFTVVKASSY